jgi:signal transduction histidine kinase
MTASAPPAQLRAVLVPDLLVALLVALLELIGSGVSLEDDWQISVSGDEADRWLPDSGGLLLLLAGSLPLTFRRLAPLPVLALSAVASLAYQASGHRPEPLPLQVLVALYTVAVVLRPVICSVSAAVYVVALTLGAITGWLPLTDDQYYIDLVSVVATVMLGYGVALSRARATLAEQQAAALTRDQDVRMRAAVEQEQARIAREVHDIVAHDVSVIVAQAASARRVFAAQPQTAADALASIEAVGRDALDGLRRLFGLLRTSVPESERSPQPGLDRLPWLVAQVERAGLPVELIIRGEPGPLSATVELNAFRIVQEALTNILKHAGPTRATVVLDYEAESLSVEVSDEGSPGTNSQPSPGYGLISMQQRAAMLGGELVAGPEAERGFRVSARLPVAGSTP